MTTHRELQDSVMLIRHKIMSVEGAAPLLVALDRIARVIPDREHIVDIRARHMPELIAWLQAPNGSHIPGLHEDGLHRVSFDACGGGVFVRTQPYGHEADNGLQLATDRHGEPLWQHSCGAIVSGPRAGGRPSYCPISSGCLGDEETGWQALYTRQGGQ